MGKLLILIIQLVVLEFVHSTIDNGYDCSTPEEDIDVCKDYHILNEHWRHVGNSGGDNCDVYMATGWYRFFVNGSSALIPTVCIKNSACGTTIPMRVELEERALPDEGCTMEATTCGSYVILGKWDCCVLRNKILIHNCGDFYVYKLTPPDRCHMAYCSQVVDDEFEHLTAKTGESAEIVTPTTNFEDTSTEHTQNVQTKILSDENDNILNTTTVSIEMPVTPVCGQACSLSTSAPMCSRPCDNGECIPDNYWCDGLRDCSDNSDEETCITLARSCPESLKRCPDGSCITEETVCSADSDETTPTSTVPTYTYRFPLFTTGTTELSTERQDTRLTSISSERQDTRLTSIQPSSQQSIEIMQSHSDVSDVLPSPSQVSASSSLDLTETQNQTQIIVSEILENQTASVNINSGAIINLTHILTDTASGTRDQTVSQSEAPILYSPSAAGILPTSVLSKYGISVTSLDNYSNVESEHSKDGIIPTSSLVLPSETVFPSSVTQISFTSAPVLSQSVEIQTSKPAASPRSSKELGILLSLATSSIMSERGQTISDHINILSSDFISKSSDISFISSDTTRVHYISTRKESYDISVTQTVSDLHESVQPTQTILNTPENSISPSTDMRSDLTDSVSFDTVSLSRSSAIKSTKITTDISGYVTKTYKMNSELHTSLISASPSASVLHMQTLTNDAMTSIQMEKKASSMATITPSVVPSTHRSTTTTKEAHFTSNKVLLIFRLGDTFRNALQLFRIRLQAALVKVMNRFYHRFRRIGRDTDISKTFVLEDVHILDITLTNDNLTTAQIAIDKPGNDSDELIPGTEISQLLQRVEVWQYLIAQLMDSDTKLLDVVPLDSETTSTYGEVTMTLTPRIEEDDKFDIKELFFAHFGLFISIIVITAVCIICILTALLYLRTKGKRGSWTCKTKDYYKKCEKTLLMHKNRSPGQVESPLTDVEIMNDEEQMVEKVPLTPEENLVNETNTQSSNDNTENDKYFDDKGWIIPVNEVLIENGQRILISQEDTKL